MTSENIEDSVGISSVMLYILSPFFFFFKNLAIASVALEKITEIS